MSPGIALQVTTQVQTRITMEFDHSPSVVGDPVTVSGLLERQTPDGGWTGVAGQTARVFADGNQLAEDTTAADGTWRATYAGKPTYVAVTGPGDHVDVR